MKRILILLFCFLLPALTFALHYNPQQWNRWVAQLRQEAIADGIRPAVFDYAFHHVTPSAQHLHLDRTQPEKRLTFYQYRSTRCDQYRINIGKKEFRRYRTMLMNIGREYGVSPYIITSLWGLESSYGKFPGSFSTIRSLSTLAFASRRAEFFRKELLLALHMLDDGHVQLKDLKGEWAGATGQSQFLPSSFYNYAVDHNLDGRKDIWKTYEDIFASIANYLAKNGWQAGEPWGIEVTIPRGFNQSLVNSKKEKTLQEWLLLGVKAKNQQELPRYNLTAHLIKPYGGPYLLAFHNFDVLMTWNRSTFYVGTVGYLADQLKGV